MNIYPLHCKTHGVQAMILWDVGTGETLKMTEMFTFYQMEYHLEAQCLFVF